MDIHRLKTVLDQLIKDDHTQEIEATLTQLGAALSNLVSNPGNAEFQTQISERIAFLRRAVQRTNYINDPMFRSYVDEIGGSDYFSDQMIEEINQIIFNNAGTPAVAQSQVTAIAGQRQAFLARIRQLVTTMQELNIGDEILEEGEAEIGFRIPREMFENSYSEWLEQLNEIDKVINTFSEVATGQIQTRYLGDISTSDPIVFVKVAVPVVVLIAKSVSWCIDQWKKVEEIRKLRAETAKISAVSGGEFDDMVQKIDEKIKVVVDNAIREYSLTTVNPGQKAGRDHELVNHLSFAMQSLMARIERGMTVELKFLPPPVDEKEGVDQSFQDLKEVVPTLNFPKASAFPVISLPKSTED